MWLTSSKGNSLGRTVLTDQWQCTIADSASAERGDAQDPEEDRRLCQRGGGLPQRFPQGVSFLRGRVRGPAHPC